MIKGKGKGFKFKNSHVVHALDSIDMTKPSKVHLGKTICGLRFSRLDLPDKEEIVLEDIYGITCQKCRRILYNNVGSIPENIDLITKDDYKKESSESVLDFRVVQTPRYGIVHAVDLNDVKKSSIPKTYCGGHTINVDRLPNSIKELRNSKMQVTCYNCQRKITKHHSLSTNSLQLNYLTKEDFSFKSKEPEKGKHYYIVDMKLRQFFKDYLKISISNNYFQKPTITISKHMVLRICLSHINEALGVRDTPEADQYARTLLHSIYENGLLNIYKAEKVPIKMPVETIVKDIEIL